MHKMKNSAKILSSTRPLYSIPNRVELSGVTAMRWVIFNKGQRACLGIGLGTANILY